MVGRLENQPSGIPYDIYPHDARDIENDFQASLPDGSVQCVVTSPPYYGLRDYGNDNQIGLEPTPQEYVAEMVKVFRGIKRVLKDDGTVWLNIGDSYSSGGKRQTGRNDANRDTPGGRGGSFRGGSVLTTGILDGGKPKDLLGIPWRVAFALQDDGWYLRQDIIWSKPNPMPESVKDRCTKSHEYLFLLTKSQNYYYDAAAIAEPVALSTVARLSQPNLEYQQGSDRVPGKTNGAMKAVAPRFGGSKYGDDDSELNRTKSGNDYVLTEKRNRRSVWNVATQPYKGAHFAVMPLALVEPCVLAGSRPGDIVLDPFMGSGTVLEVATRLGRKSVGFEINDDYIELALDRLEKMSLPLPMGGVV